MSKNRWIYYIAIVIHIFCVIAFMGSSDLDYGTPIWGATYFGDVKFYANSILLFGIYLLYSFGETRSYISGYGILQMMRSLRREVIVWHILVRQLKNVILLTVILYSSFIIECIVMKYHISSVKTDKLIVNIILFGIVMYSLLLWQSLFELMVDERIAIGIILCFIIINIIIGNAVYIYGLNDKLNLLLYVNLYGALRTDNMTMSAWVMISTLVLICILQIWLLWRVTSKKDIYQMSSF